MSNKSLKPVTNITMMSNPVKPTSKAIKLYLIFNPPYCFTFLNRFLLILNRYFLKGCPLVSVALNWKRNLFILRRSFQVCITIDLCDLKESLIHQIPFKQVPERFTM